MSSRQQRRREQRTPAGIILPPSRGAQRPKGWLSVPSPAGVPGELFREPELKLTAIRSRDPVSSPSGLVDLRWHLSVSHADRIPTWGELGAARDALLPADVWLMVAHPPREYWLNFDSRVLHLWEFRDPALIEQFRFEGELAQRAGFGTPDDGETRPPTEAK